jgi:uncharacterized membrane-anchored protein
MSEPLDQPNSKPDKTWLSSLLLVLGIVSVIAALLAFFTGNILAGLSGLAICAILLALGRALDYLQEIVHRLDRLDRKSDKI